MVNNNQVNSQLHKPKKNLGLLQKRLTRPDIKGQGRIQNGYNVLENPLGFYSIG